MVFKTKSASRSLIRGVASFIACSSFLMLGLAASANADDSNADAPIGFAAAASGAQGVILRVPVNERGEENTDAAEIRFLHESMSGLSEAAVATAWDRAITAEADDTLLGRSGPQVDPRADSSTWGWNWWRWNGWVRPYYYATYWPTFYYNGWYRYNYYSYWNWGYYRYYYYNWYW